MELKYRDGEHYRQTNQRKCGAAVAGGELKERSINAERTKNLEEMRENT